MTTNPLHLEIIQPLGGLITCLCSSAHWQKVILTWGNTTITFQGAGVGVAMKLADGSTVYPMHPSLQNYTITVQFQYSEAGACGPFHNSIIEEPIFIPNRHHTQILITCDDRFERMNNDAMLMINYESNEKRRSIPVKEMFSYAHQLNDAPC